MIHEPHRQALRRTQRPIGLLLAVAVLVWLLPGFGWMRGIAGYTSLHLVLEIASVIVATMVFAIAWTAVERLGRHDAPWLGATFLGVALLDLAHALSYPGMPDFLTPSGPEKAIDFWLAARSLAAAGMLALVFVGPRVGPARRSHLIPIGLVTAFVAVVGVSVIGHIDALPRTFVPGVGLTPLKIAWEYLLIAAYAVVALRLLLRGASARPFDVSRLFVAACTMAMSEFFFTLYADVTDLYNLTGHAYKVIGYAYLYAAIFVESIERPYRELSATQDRLRSTLETIPDLLWLKDADGVFLDCNPTFERLYGAPRADIVGRTDRDFVGPELAESFRHHDLKAMASGGPSVNEEWLSFAADGYRGLFETVKTPMHDRSGRLVGVLGIARDITDRQRAEQARLALEAQLREAQRMESIGTLAGGIAHDFNNVLGAVLGHLALARDEVPAGHPARPHLDMIERSSHRARHLVQQILTFGRRQPQTRAEVDLRPLVEESLEMLRATLPARVHLLTRLGDEPVTVYADGTQIQQVLMNLCTNAWHALNDGAGEIEVGLEAQGAGDAGASGMDASLPRAHVWVRDSGVGMDEATRARIFEPFFTTKGAGKGTGLGLSVVHGIVSAHDGAIRVESQPGQGSTFHVYLPCLRGPASEARPVPAPAARAVAGHGRHVLYVDDDEVMLAMVAQLLRRDGWRVSTRARAAEALSLVAASPADVDVVVTDYNMPDGSGLELAAALANVRADLPVIVSSGHVSDELLAGVRAAHVQHVMQKENTLEQLPRLLGEVLPV